MAAVFAQLIVGGEARGVHALLVPIRDDDGTVARRRAASRTAARSSASTASTTGASGSTTCASRARRCSTATRRSPPTATYTSPIENPTKRFFTMLGTLIQGRVSVCGAAISATKVGARRSPSATRWSGASSARPARRGGAAARLPHPPAPAAARARARPTRCTSPRSASSPSCTRSSRRPRTPTTATPARARDARRGPQGASRPGTRPTRSRRAARRAAAPATCATNRFAALKADTDVFTTFEGDNTVLLQLVRQEPADRLPGPVRRARPARHGAVRRRPGARDVAERTASRGCSPGSPTTCVPGRDDGADLLDRETQLELFRWREEHIARRRGAAAQGRDRRRARPVRRLPVSAQAGAGRRRGRSSSPEAALARGMVLGQDEAIDETTRQDWRDSGLSHLLAVSGQNVMLLVALAMPLLALMRHRAAGTRTALLALMALYVPLAGAGPSLQRAGVMGAAGIAAMTLSRPASRWYALLLAAAATLALNPRVSADPGWQLSFAAVAGILAMGRPLAAALARAGEELAERAAARPRAVVRGFAEASRSRLQPLLRPVRSWRSTSVPCRLPDWSRTSWRCPPWRPRCGSGWSRPPWGSSAASLRRRGRSRAARPADQDPARLPRGPRGALRRPSPAAGWRCRCTPRRTSPPPTCSSSPRSSPPARPRDAGGVPPPAGLRRAGRRLAARPAFLPRRACSSSCSPSSRSPPPPASARRPSRRPDREVPRHRPGRRHARPGRTRRERPLRRGPAGGRRLPALRAAGVRRLDLAVSTHHRATTRAASTS